MSNKGKRSRGIIIAGVIVAALGLITFVIRRPSTSGDGGPRIRAIVLISIDTCRPDYLSCYGYSRPTTPNIDALAKEGVRFAEVIAPTPLTLPSHASMLTGTIPPQHGVHGNGTYRLDDDQVTLAEALKGKGFATAAVVGAFVLDAQFGLGQGFETYNAAFPRDPKQDQILSTRRAVEVNRAVETWLDGRGEGPFFLFVHYYDVHHPYDPPEPYATRYADMPYAGEVAYVDAQIGKLMSSLKRRGLYEDAMVIVTSDHGEALGSHKELSHGYFVYHETTHVPLIMKGPGIDAGRVVEAKAALVDIVPTVLDLLGIDRLPDLAGRSLVSALRGRSSDGPDRRFYVESLMPAIYDCSPLFAVETKTWKYIHTTKPELYDLTADPGETQNLFARQPQRAAGMRKQLEAILAAHPRLHRDDNSLTPSRESVKRLATLGYITGGDPNAPLDLDTGWEDPKDFLRFFIGINMANELSYRDPKKTVAFPRPDGQTMQVWPFEAAKSICKEMLAARPNLKKVHAILGRIAAQEGDWETSLKQMETLLALDPQSAATHHDLADALSRLGRLDEAKAHYETAVHLASPEVPLKDGAEGLLKQMGRIDPAWFESQVGLADVLFRQRRDGEAIEQYRKVLAMDPLATGPMSLDDTIVLARYRIGVSLARLGRQEEAAASFREVLKKRPGHRPAREALERVEAKKVSTP